MQYSLTDKEILILNDVIRNMGNSWDFEISFTTIPNIFKKSENNLKVESIKNVIEFLIINDFAEYKSNYRTVLQFIKPKGYELWKCKTIEKYLEKENKNKEKRAREREENKIIFEQHINDYSKKYEMKDIKGDVNLIDVNQSRLESLSIKDKKTAVENPPIQNEKESNKNILSNMKSFIKIVLGTGGLTALLGILLEIYKYFFRHKG